MHPRSNLLPYWHHATTCQTNPTSADSVGASERESEANPTESPTPEQVAGKRKAHANADTISRRRSTRRPHKSQATEKGNRAGGRGVAYSCGRSSRRKPSRRRRPAARARLQQRLQKQMGVRRRRNHAAINDEARNRGGTVSLGIGARTRTRTCLSEGRGSGGGRGSDAGHEGR